MEIKSIAEAKKAFIWNKEYSGQYILEILEELEKSVREKANSGHNEHCWTDACLHDALKEVLGEEKEKV